jgi:C-terminal processing protease CtpA/Prc
VVSRPRVVAVAPGSPAARAGLQVGDELAALVGVEPVPEAQDVVLGVFAQAGDEVGGRGRHARSLSPLAA